MLSAPDIEEFADCPDDSSRSDHALPPRCVRVPKTHSRWRLIRNRASTEFHQGFQPLRFETRKGEIDKCRQTAPAFSNESTGEAGLHGIAKLRSFPIAASRERIDFNGERCRTVTSRGHLPTSGVNPPPSPRSRMRTRSWRRVRQLLRPAALLQTAGICRRGSRRCYSLLVDF